MSDDTETAQELFDAQCVIGGLLTQPAYVEAARGYGLTAGDLPLAKYAHTLAIIYRLHDEHGAGSATPVNVMAELRAGQISEVTIADIAIWMDGHAMHSPESFELPVRRLRMAAERQRAIEAGGQIAAAAAAGNLDKAASIAEQLRERRRASSTEYVVAPAAGVVTLRDIQRMQFAPRIWFIDGLLTTGAAILAGRAKAKKSWLALGLSLAAAHGGRAFGQLECRKATVLYLDLEADHQQIQERAYAILGNELWPENFHIATEWPAGDEGLDKLDAWLTQHPESVVVIDIYINIRPPRQKGMDIYDEDRKISQALQRLGLKHRSAIIALHHVTKDRKVDDVFNEINGTMGVQGGFGTLLVLRPDNDEPGVSILHPRGRSLRNDEPLALKWDDYTCTHILTGSAEQYATSAEGRRLLRLMADDREYSLAELATELNKSKSATSNLVGRLNGERLVEKSGYGRYRKVLRRETRESRESSESRESGETEDSQIHIDSHGECETFLASGSAETASFTRFTRSVENVNLEPRTYSTDGVQLADGTEQWRVWDDATDHVVAVFATEAEAIAHATQLLEDHHGAQSGT